MTHNEIIIFLDHGNYYSVDWRCNPRSLSWLLRLPHQSILFAANAADRNRCADLFHCVFRLLWSMARELLHGVNGKCQRVFIIQLI